MTRSARIPPQAEAAFRRLPSVEEASHLPALAPLLERWPRPLSLDFVRAALGAWRAEIRAGAVDAEGIERRLARGELAAAVEALAEREGRRGLRRAINATGVVLHTGLGRAPVHPEVADAMAEAARSLRACSRSSARAARRSAARRAARRAARARDRRRGRDRGQQQRRRGAARAARPSRAAGARWSLSRGELVEIGGSFRMPDVMERAGVRLRRGRHDQPHARSRTTARRFARAHRAPAQGAHLATSACRASSQEVPAAELAALGAERGLPTALRPRLRAARGRAARRRSPDAGRRAARARRGRQRRRRRHVLGRQAARRRRRPG